MKTLLKTITPVILILLLISPVSGQMVSRKEATRIAENGIHVTIEQYGSWGKYKKAEILPMHELMRDDRKLGYVCNVNPEGYIVLSLRRELGPVKAYSPRGCFDITKDHTGEDIIKTFIISIIDTIESQLGTIESFAHVDLAPLLEMNYTETWEAIYNYIPGTWNNNHKAVKGNYQEGDSLLGPNNWHQYPPYNEQCPYMGCTTTSNGNAKVGCVATARSQIMYHWSWPPNDVNLNSYDWPNMQDVVTTSSPQAVIDAVAELGHEVGVAANMNYGCDGSSTYLSNMRMAFEAYYRYSTNCDIYYRDDYTGAISWFE